MLNVRPVASSRSVHRAPSRRPALRQVTALLHRQTPISANPKRLKATRTLPALSKALAPNRPSRRGTACWAGLRASAITSASASTLDPASGAPAPCTTLDPAIIAAMLADLPAAGKVPHGADVGVAQAGPDLIDAWLRMMHAGRAAWRRGDDGAADRA